MTTSLTYNPAAVLGTALAQFALETPGHAPRTPGLSLTAHRSATRSSKYAGRIYVADPQLARELEQMAIAKDSYSTITRGLHFNGIEYDELLEAGARLFVAGARTEDALLREQLESKVRGNVQSHDRIAYDEFEMRATSALKAVLALGLTDLTGVKPPKAVESTRRSVTVRNGQRGIYLYPDPYDPRFIEGDIFKPTDDDYRQVRNKLYDELERYGYRLDLHTH